jgi:SMI1 / KNR4 family (SUKH-1)
MDEHVVERILAARRRRLLGWRPVFERYEAVSESDLADLENRIGCALPASLRAWLLRAGYGDFNDELSLRRVWFTVIDQGELKGHLVFAQDDLGNFYSFDPAGGGVHYLCRSAPEYACMASDFCAFLKELERRAFELQPWVQGLAVKAHVRGV